VSDNKIIPFPTNRIVEPTKVGQQMDTKTTKKIQDHQTKQFVETAVDDISMTMLRQLYELSVDTDSKTQKPLSSDVKNELKDLNDQSGFFDGDNLDD
jgi:hypothetical protein